MLKLENTIQIGTQSFDYVNELEVVSTWDKLTDTATIRLPKKARFEKDGEIIANLISGENPLFKRGLSCYIDSGYSGQSARRFEGYLSKIIPDSPLKLELQDSMYLLKQKTIKAYSKEGLTLKTLLKDITKGIIEVEINQNFTIGKYAITTATIAQVLEHLRKNYGVVSYIRDNKLQSGFAYPLQQIDNVKIVEINIDNVGIDISDLYYNRDDDERIKIKAISIYPDNTRSEIIEGDTDGGERTQYFYNLSVEDLKIQAKERLKKIKFTGYKGSFTTFINPIIRHGDAVKIISDKPDREGVYMVKKVVTRSGVEGGRQTVYLDFKL
jgi:hypothetical protein